MDIDERETDAMSRFDFDAFAQKCFAYLNPGARLDRSWRHEAIARQLDRMLRGRAKLLVMIDPPRSLESHFGPADFRRRNQPSNS